MPYLGSSPARGLVGTADIDDDAVTLAKMASGTDGNVISYDASTNPVAIATGTSGHFLKSQGAGAQPVFAAAGGAWNIIGTSVASGSASLTITGLDSTYDTYAIALSDLVPATDNVTAWIRFGDSGGFDSGASDYAWLFGGDRVTNASMSPDGKMDDADAQIKLNDDSTIGGVGSAAGEGVGGFFTLNRPGDGTTYPNISGTLTNIGTVPYISAFHVGAARLSAITLDRIQFLFSSGNVATGRLTVWGIAHA
jgi:hypothetical protein